jgi:hypothetical protein
MLLLVGHTRNGKTTHKNTMTKTDSMVVGDGMSEE